MALEVIIFTFPGGWRTNRVSPFIFNLFYIRLDRVGLRRGHMEHSQWEILRPGATRLNLSWFSSHLENQFVIDAVKLVAEEGWKLLPLYRFNNETGTRCSTNSDGHHFCERTKFLRTNEFFRIDVQKKTKDGQMTWIVQRNEKR